METQKPTFIDQLVLNLESKNITMVQAIKAIRTELYCSLETARKILHKHIGRPIYLVMSVNEDGNPEVVRGYSEEGDAFTYIVGTSYYITKTILR